MVSGCAVSALVRHPTMEVAAATAGFLSLSIQLTQNLLNFYSAYRSQRSDVTYTIKKLDHLLGVLEALSS